LANIYNKSRAVFRYFFARTFPRSKTSQSIQKLLFQRETNKIFPSVCHADMHAGAWGNRPPLTCISMHEVVHYHRRCTCKRRLFAGAVNDRDTAAYLPLSISATWRCHPPCHAESIFGDNVRIALVGLQVRAASARPQWTRTINDRLSADSTQLLLYRNILHVLHNGPESRKNSYSPDTRQLSPSVQFQPRTCIHLFKSGHVNNVMEVLQR
jgi:hypothetical protein